VTSADDFLAQRRRLARQLKELRSHAGLTQRQVAASLDWSPSKIIRIENGEMTTSAMDMRTLLTLYGAGDQAMLDLMIDTARSGKQTRYSQYRNTLLTETLLLMDYEAVASRTRQLALNAVPDLLQIEEYTRAQLAAQNTSASAADLIVESIRTRQKLFDRPAPPDSYFVLDESILYRSIGGSNVMKAQIDHLEEMASHSNVTLRVLPLNVGAKFGTVSAFTLLEFSDMDERGVVFIESAFGVGAALVRDRGTVLRYEMQFAELENNAQDLRPSVYDIQTALSSREVELLEQAAELRQREDELRTEVARLRDLADFDSKSDTAGGIFVSYSHVDADVVDAIAGRFEEDGINYWRDEKDMYVGEVIDQAISKGIQQSLLFMIVLTPASINSRWVERELNEASFETIEGRKVLLPVVAKDLRIGDIPPRLRSRLFVDLSANFDAGYARLRDSIRHHFRQYRASP
jgi:transcriptional regulator with XRE-family HTH domain